MTLQQQPPPNINTAVFVQLKEWRLNILDFVTYAYCFLNMEICMSTTKPKILSSWDSRMITLSNKLAGQDFFVFLGGGG